MMKKLLVSLLVGLSFSSVVNAQTKVDKTHWLVPVMVKQEYVEGSYGTHYFKNYYYDMNTGKLINLEEETIYIDEEDNRWYFPYDNAKFHPEHDQLPPSAIIREKSKGCE